LALLAGAGGRTGRLIAADLVARGIAVRGLTLDAADAPPLPGVTWVVGDVTKAETLAAAVTGATYVISAIGASSAEGPNSFETVDWAGNRNLIDAAKKAGVRHMILMSSGTAGEGTWTDPRLNRAGGGRAWKTKAEIYLRGTGLPYTIVAPGGLRDYAGDEQGVRLAPRSTYIVGAVSRADVAAVIAACTGEKMCVSKTITIINDAAAAPGAWRSQLTALPIDTPETIRGGDAAPAERTRP
jgi:uncharacterized protein YbjT (DUF2867 family)